MVTVYLYPGSGKFGGPAALDWKSPRIGSTHKFILFVAQEVSAVQPAIAQAQLERLGFSELEVGEGKPIAVEALNEPVMQAFQKHYEGALAAGYSLVWYP